MDRSAAHGQMLKTGSRAVGALANGRHGLCIAHYPSLQTHINPRGIPMLQTIAIVLIILWLLGMVSSYTMGGFIHILLVIAVIMFLVRLIGR
jgi:hypothetical protein